MKFWAAFIAILALVFWGLQAFAEDKPGCEKQSAACQAKAVAAKDGGGCASAQKGDAKGCCSKKDAEAGMPVVTYRVGDQELCCDKKADELAKAGNTAIKFVVDGKTYDKKEEALDAYAGVLEKYYDGMFAVKYAVGDDCGTCPVTASKLAKEKNLPVKYQIASVRFNDEAVAKKAAESAKTAAEKVVMTMVVGNEKFECPMHAKDAADKAGKPVEYAVGECHTPCKTTARVELAKARISAAMKILTETAGA